MTIMPQTKASETWNVSMEYTMRFKHYPLVIQRQIYQYTPPVMQGFMGMFSAWFHSGSVLSKTKKYIAENNHVLILLVQEQ